MSKFCLKYFLLTGFVLFLFSNISGQTGNHVFSGAEMTNFSAISLSTPAGKSWSTDRTATPGYFSATMGSVYTNATDNDHVNGYVKKYGNEAYTFPAGTGTDLRTLSISAPALTTDAYATAWVLGDPSGNLDPTGPNSGPHDINARTLPINAVSKVGFWDWQNGIDMGNTGDGSGLTITVSIPDMSAFATTAGLRLLGWNGSSWIDLSGASTASGTAENSMLTGTMVPGISAIGIGSIYWVLPLKLVFFTATENQCAVTLNWTTTNEQNMARFDVEQGNGGSSYHLVGSVEARNKTEVNKYSFSIDQSEPFNNYRLKMIDKDGQFTYSHVTLARVNCKPGNDNVSVYPDPARNGYAFIEFTSDVAAPASLILYNTTGQQILQQKINITQGNNLTRLELSRIPQGVYYIKLVSTGNNAFFQPQKIIIE